jgi:hypothetical protein
MGDQRGRQIFTECIEGRCEQDICTDSKNRNTLHASKIIMAKQVSYTKYMSDVEMTHKVLVSFIDRFIHTQCQVNSEATV